MEPFIGQIMLFAGTFAPRGWAFCDGQLLPIAQNATLFSIIGTTYGGDGRTTFALPDLRGRAPIGPRHGPGLSDYRLGQAVGRESLTLTTNELPAHTHPTQLSLSFAPPAHTGAGDSDHPSPTATPAATGGVLAYSNSPADTTLAGGAVSGQVTVGNTGGNQPVDIRPPRLAVNYCIALVGLFPSRD